MKHEADFSAARADLVNTEWDFCPSTPAAILFAVLFALSTLVHLAQGILYKKLYSWVIVCSGLAQTLNFIFRVISIKNPTNLGDYTAWFVLVLASYILSRRQKRVKC